jgi:hypothetical protein
MEDVVTGFAALVLQGIVAILRASVRPWQYCFSATRRSEIRHGWDADTKLKKYFRIFGGGLVMLLSIVVVGAILWGSYIALKPKPTPIDRIKHHIQETIK